MSVRQGADLEFVHAEDEADLCLDGFGGGEVVVMTRKKPGRDGPNQDAALALDLGAAGALVALADGMGGLPAGEVAAGVALFTLEATVREVTGAGGDLRHGILDGFDRANRAVLDLRAGAGTTLVVVELQPGSARAYHVGDSAALLVGQRGKQKYRSTSHSPVGYAVEAGLLDEEEALHHEERHLISNALGSTEMHIEIGPEIDLAARDTLLVASDGLWDNAYPHEIVDAVRKGPLAGASVGLRELCLARMLATPPEAGEPVLCKPDDLTLVLYRPRALSRRGRGAAPR
ncbi:MAG: protein phosphatase 2C domain-containing protein [Planctomycetes bacterium]|nr:protein phosphatase 2C domain-containing protein [Planctomycetota bacterium]